MKNKSEINEANKKFHFELNSFERVQYTQYWGPDYSTISDRLKVKSPTDVKHPSRFGTHYDCAGSGSGSLRKLTFSVNLSAPEEYEGGECKVFYGEGGEILPAGKGEGTGFPSFILHEVFPVTKGVREVLVCWVIGSTHFR